MYIFISMLTTVPLFRMHWHLRKPDLCPRPFFTNFFIGTNCCWLRSTPHTFGEKINHLLLTGEWLYLCKYISVKKNVFWFNLNLFPIFQKKEKYTSTPVSPHYHERAWAQLQLTTKIFSSPQQWTSLAISRTKRSGIWPPNGPVIVPLFYYFGF